MSRTVLFLCTGNYYRSRFAELLFNHLASKAGLDYVATSRALALEKGAGNVGPISPHALSGLLERGVTPAGALRFPIQCCERDLSDGVRIVALKEAEHRPFLRKQFPAWEDRVEYWHVHDLDQSVPTSAWRDRRACVAARRFAPEGRRQRIDEEPRELKKNYA